MKEVSLAISVDSVSKTFGRGRHRTRALDNVSVQVKEGSVTALLGPNGAGKTTLIHAILGLVVTDHGGIELLGRSATDPRSRREIGFLPEEVTYEAGLKIREIIGLHALLARAKRGRGLEEALAAVDWALPFNRPVSHCSHGTARRLALACALIGQPRLLILDEPTSGMDIDSRDRLIALLRGVAANGSTVLISSHVLSELESCCDSYVILNKGRVTRTGDLEPGCGIGLQEIYRGEIGG